MKSLKYVPILVALLAISGVPSAVADSSKMVQVTNSTSYSLYEFYASPSVNSAWDTSTNLLSGQTLDPGQSTNITISDGTTQCRYDLMGVLWGSAEYAYTYYVNTCDGDSAHWNISSSQ